MEYDGGSRVSQISSRACVYEFGNPLHRFNGEKPWALMLTPLPTGMEYADVVATGKGWTETHYSEHTAWAHRQITQAA